MCAIKSVVFFFIFISALLFFFELLCFVVGAYIDCVERVKICRGNL